MPFLTIQHAANIVCPGDVVIVEDGTYSNETLAHDAPGANPGANLIYLTRGGTATDWVIFKSLNKWGAVIDGLNNTIGDCWNFGLGADYIRVQDFEVKGCSGIGFDNFGGGHNLEIIGNHIHHIGRYCTDTAIGLDGIFLSHDNVAVEQNVIHDIGRYGPEENGCHPQKPYYQGNDHGIYISGANNIAVRDNIFYSNNHGWSLTIYSPGSRSDNISVVSNVFAFANPWKWGQIFMGAHITNSKFDNNNFYWPSIAAVYFWNKDNYSNVIFSNNSMSQGTAMASTSQGPVTDVPGVTFANNNEK